MPEVAALPSIVVHGLQKTLTLYIEKKQRSVIAQGQVSVHNVDEPPDPPPFFSLLFRDVPHAIAVEVMLIIAVVIQVPIVANRSWAGRKLSPELQLPRE